MCKGNGELSLRTVWQNLVLGINRRGYSSSGKVEDGCVMGWTGCTDTILHATIVSYVVHKAKMRGILHTKESAYSYELIDDSVLDLQLDALADLAADRVSRFLELMVEHYASLGLEIDRVKTIMSTVKMTFLNRVFSCGAEVLTPAKVAAKVDREITRRFSSILEQIAALFTSASSASARAKHEVVALLIGARKRKEISDGIRDKDKFFRFLPAYLSSTCESFPLVNNATAFTRRYREEFYIFVEVLSVPGEQKTNMYWGRAEVPHRDLHVKPVARDQISLGSHIPGVRNLMRAHVMICSSKREADSMAAAWLKMPSRAWVGNDNLFKDVIIPTTVIANTKSILSQFRVVNAAIFAYPNTQGIVNVDASSLLGITVREIARLFHGLLEPGQVRHYAEDLQFSLVPNTPILASDISDDVQRAIEGMPHYVEGEIEEPEQVSMAVDVSNIFADPTDLPVMFRHLLYPTQGPLPLRPPRRTSSVGFDVKPHDEQPAPREPGDELRDLEYVTDRLTAMVSVLRNHTAAVFGNVIVHLPHHEALAEFLMVTGFPTGNINAEMPGTLMLASFALVLPFDSDLADMAKRNAKVYWERAVKDSLKSFINLVSGVRVPMTWDPSAKYRDVMLDILGFDSPVDEAINAPVGFLQKTHDFWNVCEYVIYMYLRIRNYLSRSHVPVEQAAVMQRAPEVGMGLDEFSGMFQREEHPSSQFGDKTLYYSYIASRGLPFGPVSSAYASSRIAQIMDEQQISREEFWDRYYLADYVLDNLAEDDDDTSTDVDTESTSQQHPESSPTVVERETDDSQQAGTEPSRYNFRPTRRVDYKKLARSNDIGSLGGVLHSARVFWSWFLPSYSLRVSWGSYCVHIALCSLFS
ncbi:unnamed protein product [Heligmosomoides polygyrus]|uniref:RNA-directed RNA polymerase n=1 Tax=Heligmosomoides polygyrus TaxID=6339 RepID=A0A183GDM9_HELPZ|nr:unnamed protein product [Heligmosomoides polygyrus]